MSETAQPAARDKSAAQTERQEFAWIPGSLTDVFEDCFAEGGVSTRELPED